METGFVRRAASASSEPINSSRPPDNSSRLPAGKLNCQACNLPQLLALSPDQRLLVTAGKHNVLALIYSTTRRLVQEIPLTTTAAETIGPAVETGLTGLTFSPDGQKLFVSTDDGCVRAFSVHGTNISKVAQIIPLPVFENTKKDVPAGLAVG